MRRLAIPGAWYTDAAVTGEWAALIRDSRIANSEGRDVPLCPGGNVLYLRMLMHAGVMYLGGQGHSDGAAWLWNGASWIRCAPFTNGQKVVAFGPDGLYVAVNGWVVAVYALDGTLLRVENTPTGSGGIQFVTGAGQIVTGDSTYRADRQPPFLAEWNYAGGVYVGQSYVDGCVAVNGSTRVQIEPGNCTFTHLYRDGDNLAVSMVKPDGAVCYWLTVADLASFLPEPSATVPPVVTTPNPVIIPPIQEPPSMQLPASVKAIRASYVAKFPIPQTPGGGDAHEEQVRQWSIRFAEQVAFQLPFEGWGMKRADANRPISKDTIAQRRDGRLLIWDLLFGTWTGSPTLVDDPQGEDVTGQVFVPVTPINHLGMVTPVPPVPVPPVPPSPPPDELVLVQIRALLREIATDVAEIKARTFPVYTGKTPLKAGGTLTLKPKE